MIFSHSNTEFFSLTPQSQTQQCCAHYPHPLIISQPIFPNTTGNPYLLPSNHQPSTPTISVPTTHHIPLNKNPAKNQKPYLLRHASKSPITLCFLTNLPSQPTLNFPIIQDSGLLDIYLLDISDFSDASAFHNQVIHKLYWCHKWVVFLPSVISPCRGYLPDPLGFSLAAHVWSKTTPDQHPHTPCHWFLPSWEFPCRVYLRSFFAGWCIHIVT